MPDRKGRIVLEFYCSMPDDDLAADQAFDDICDAIDSELNAAAIVGVFPQSFSVLDGDTTDADLDE